MANNTNYIKERHTAKYTAKVLKIQVSTLRKYSSLLEKSGYTFTKSNQNHRSYSIHDILVLNRLMRKKNDTDMTLEQASNSLMKEMMGEDGAGINSEESLSGGAIGQEEGKEYLKRQEEYNKLLLERLNQIQYCIEKRGDS